MPSAVATSYGPPWGGIQGGGTTATGIDLHGSPHKLIVAVDPSVIPLGSRLKVWPNPFGDPNLIFTAADTGGAIKGSHIDFYDWRGRTAQTDWGVKSVDYKIVGKGSGAAASSLDGAAPAAGSPPSPAAGQPADPVQGIGGSLLKGFLELAFVAGGVVLVGAGLYRSANATPAGRAFKRAGVKVAKDTAELGAA